MALQKAACIGDQGEASRVTLRETIAGKGGDRQDNRLLHLTADALPGHSRPEPPFDIPHALLGAFETHCPPQLFGLSPGEIGDDHCHTKQLLLEEGDTERPFQDWLKQWVEANRLLES